MKTTVLYVGSSLLGPLRHAEGEINRRHRAGLRVAAHNLGAPLSEGQWSQVERDLSESEVVFVIHVTDGENASRLIPLLKKFETEIPSIADLYGRLCDITHPGATSVLSYSVDDEDGFSAWFDPSQEPLVMEEILTEARSCISVVTALASLPSTSLR